MMVNNDILGVPYTDMNGKIDILRGSVQGIDGIIDMFNRTLL